MTGRLRVAPPASVMERAGYGTVDYAHVQGVRAAYRVAGSGTALDHELSLGVHMAMGFEPDGREQVGAFLVAYMTTLAAIELEHEDLRSAFSVVAKQWWADPAHQHRATATYGAPWSPPARETAVTHDVAQSLARAL